MRTEDFFGQFVQELCIMLAEVMLQFMGLQPAFANESVITILTFSQNLPKKGGLSHFTRKILIFLRHLVDDGTARTSSIISAMSSGKAKVVARSALVMKLYL